jgi:hypothetical protein
VIPSQEIGARFEDVSDRGEACVKPAVELSDQVTGGFRDEIAELERVALDIEQKPGAVGAFHVDGLSGSQTAVFERVVASAEFMERAVTEEKGGGIGFIRGFAPQEWGPISALALGRDRLP